MNPTTLTPNLETPALPPSNPPKGQREYQAFLRLMPELLPRYHGKFVAIHDGRVVDSDTDDIKLVQRVHNQVGYVPIHVGLVTEQPPVIRIPHYREYRPKVDA
jgi:hypothetical protein